MSKKCLILNNKGQSLVEILIALGIGVLMIGAIATILTANLKSSLTVKTTQTVAAFSQELLDAVKSIAGADWHNIYNLPHGSGNQYYVVNMATSSIFVGGQESIFTNDVNSGLVGYWKFDEATGTIAYDSSGNGDGGTLTNNPTRLLLNGCKAGSCMSFNGTSYVDIKEIGQTLSVTNMLTFAVWIYPTSNTVYQPILGKVPSGYNAGYEFANSSGALRTTLRTSGGNCDYTTGSLLLNQWQYVVSTYDGNVVKHYINGSLVGTSSVCTFGAAITTSDLYIAGRAADGSRFFGNIDDARIYNRALSASEVQALYNNSVFTRYFYVENVNRDSCGIGNITSNATTSCTFGSSGVADDPSTQKITDVINNTNGNVLLTEFEYLTRSRNYSFNQNNWSGGAGQNGTVLQPNTLFSSSTNVNYASGTIQLILP